MKKVLCFAAVIILLAIPCRAAEKNFYERQMDALGADELARAVPDDASDIELSADLSFKDGLAVIWDKLCRNLRSVLTSGMKCVVSVVAVSMLGGTVSAMGTAKDSASVNLALSLTSALAVTAAASGTLRSVIGMGRDLIYQIDSFSKALLPTIAAAEAASGVPGAAIAKAAASAFFGDVLISLISSVLLPLVYINIFAATANAAVRNDSLRRIGDMATKIVSVSLKFLLGAFISYITVAGIVSGSVDKAGLRVMQLAAGGVPVVGGIMADAAETVLSGAAVIKNTIGVFGMLVVLSACVVPFCSLAGNYILFKVCAVCASPMIGGSISELCDRLGQSFGLVLAMASSCVTVIFITVVAAMSSAGVG